MCDRAYGGVPMKKSDEYRKREAKLRVDRMHIGQDAIELANTEDSESEDSTEAMERHVEAAIDTSQTQAPESIWERRFTLLEEEVSVMRVSMDV
ncbi:hypothetical protein HAX54_005520 [Datura stramonium]|uniref:Uncharacterized protein n=1 Tax=Datura stramonium TaxID=4076 RepID=A0ABS8TA69_DATST|nr:hypothetical protein [Datura stramonium]